jgi:O-antigen ligase
MVTIRLKTLVFLTCLIETAWLLIAQTLGNTFILIPCLVCFMALVAWGTLKGMALPILLYFLPLAALLKTKPGETSFFTIALIMVYAICFVLGHKRIGIMHIIPGAVLISLCLLVKTFHNYELDKSFILFAISLLLVPYASIEFGKKYDFYWLTLFFTAGISIAAISALYLVEFSSIARYIEYFELAGVVRHSGYYGDPNFYSAHISAALAGVLILLLNDTSKKKMITLILMLMLLTYCGFLAVSKTFFLISIFLFLFFILQLLFMRGKLSIKLLLFLTFLTGAAFLLLSTAFSDLVDMIIYRFSDDSNLSDFTTGRTELWLGFYHAFKEDIVLLLFGKGYTSVKLIERGAHNTIIQSIYQFGIIGCVPLVSWAVFYIRAGFSNTKIKKTSFTQICLLLLGTIGPWMALDLLFFDELFLIPMYIFVGIMSMPNDGKMSAVARRRKRF